MRYTLSYEQCLLAGCHVRCDHTGDDRNGCGHSVIHLSHFRILQSLIELGKSLGCYKITLNCKDKMIPYYERLGFVAEEGNANFLVIRVQSS